ncbi:MAG: DUF364 domain-containing protein [Euryarchaeota archaeon]|nr:DUF364 domain-containing protein [Euryarchaeota archaeon]
MRGTGGARIALVGFQPVHARRCSERHELRILDLDPENLGKEKFGVVVLDGSTDMEEVLDWCDLVLVTGTTVVNGTLKKIAMVGHFPMVDDLRKVADELWVMERQPQKGDLPDTAAEHLIPQADIVAITSSAIVNKSIERLLELSQGFTIVLGPGTPMSEVLFDYGVDMIAGIRVADEATMMAKIAQGCGKVKQFKDVIEFLVMER